jgi:hypothetical protein
MNDREHFAHHLRLRCKQIAKLEWNTENPLPNGFLWQHFINQVCSKIPLVLANNDSKNERLGCSALS